MDKRSRVIVTTEFGVEEYDNLNQLAKAYGVVSSELYKKARQSNEFTHLFRGVVKVVVNIVEAA